MKLYYFPPMVSIAPLIAAVELGFDLKLERIDPENWLAESGAPFESINPKRCIPALQLDDGAVLTETSAILIYLADLPGDNALIPAPGNLSRYRVYEWVSYLSSEIHKLFTFLFWEMDDRVVRLFGERIWQRFSFANDALEGRHYLVDDRYSIADLYLFAVLRGLHLLDYDLAAYPNLLTFRDNILGRDAVKHAIAKHV